MLAIGFTSIQVNIQSSLGMYSCCMPCVCDGSDLWERAL
jgi:hypothetical protein